MCGRHRVLEISDGLFAGIMLHSMRRAKCTHCANPACATQKSPRWYGTNKRHGTIVDQDLGQSHGSVYVLALLLMLRSWCKLMLEALPHAAALYSFLSRVKDEL